MEDKEPAIDKSSSGYVRTKHEMLKNDYQTPDREHVESCTLIACEIADLLIKKGKCPSIYQVKGELVGGSKYNRETLVPKQYGGRVRWGGHIVCVENNIVYDPMLPEPTPINTYKRQAFRGKIHLTEEIPPEKILEFLSRGE